MASSSLACCVVLALGLVSAVVSSPIFFDSFEEPWEGRWIPSGKDDYQGKWKHEKSEGHEDYGLFVSEKAKKYGIAVDLPGVYNLEKSTIVLQYDLRLQNGLECGGAYLKFLLPQEAESVSKQLDNESPYSIMFGPDKCGSTNKVHFIFRHKNPNSGAYVEHHLKYPPVPVIDKLSHVYTAIIYANNTLKILIDGEEKKTVDLLSSDFEPPVVPAKTIPDPDEVKPEDWDERAKIPDPDAKKPDDWDEEAPMEIEDLEIEKPEGWLDDEPEEIEDPDAVKPEDWDDDEDGEWEAPKVPNARCEEAPGCGEWKRPKKRNPAYKGKWHSSMIDNPDYKGIWKPQQIPNPDYFELENPNLEPIAAIGIEIWTMQDGILFDNILITTDETEAKEYREKTWKLKYDVEKTQEEKPVPPAEAGAFGAAKRKVFELLYQMADAPFLASHRPRIIELIEQGENNSNKTVGVLLAILLVFSSIFYKLLCGKKRITETVPMEKAKEEDISTADDIHQENEDEREESAEQNDDEPSGEIEKDGEGASGVRPRRTRRET